MTPPAKRVEVQFVIERACPALEVPIPAHQLPYAVWVKFPGVTREDLQTDPCCDATQFFAATPRGAWEMSLHFNRDPIASVFTTIWICEHMGHVIE